MELIIKKECWMIREAMELLFLAANKEELSENKYLWNLRKFEQELTEELALQKEFLAMAKEIPVTPAIRKYFEPFQKEGLECLAKCLIWTFGGEQTDSVEEMKALALNEFRQYPLDDFPVFDRIGETLNLKKEERRRFAASVKKLDLEEKFQGRLILAFESYEESLDELGALLEEALPLLLPYRTRMQRQALRMQQEWQAYFAKKSLSDFCGMTGVYVDESLYRAVEIVPNLVNGPFMVLNMDDGEPQEDVLVIRIGFLMREKVCAGAAGRRDKNGNPSLHKGYAALWKRNSGQVRADHSHHLLPHERASPGRTDPDTAAGKTDLLQPG